MAAKKFLSGIDLSGQKLIHLADGSSSDDAATYGQLLALVNGAVWKTAAQVATTADVDISSPGATIDSIALASGNRVLVLNQSDPAENGIYVFATGSTPLVRASDADTDGELDPGVAIFVLDGTANGGTAWISADYGTKPIVIGTDNVVFTQFGAGGGPTYTAGDGIDVTGSTISAVVQADKGLSLTGSGLAAVAGDGIAVDADGIHVTAGTGITVDGGGVGIDATVVVQKYAANVGNGSSTAITITHNLGTRDVTVSLYDASSFAEVETDVVHATTNTLTLNFASAPSSNQYRVVVHG